MSAADTSLSIFDRMVSLSDQPPPGLRLWDGSYHGPENPESVLVLRHPGALRALLVPFDDLTAGEAYVFDDIDIEGDIVHMLGFAAGLDSVPFRERARVARQALTLPRERRRNARSRPSVRGRLHTLGRDRHVVRHHYDTGNEFFDTFLGKSMVYSCAYFLDPNEDLDVAQTRKLDLVCRKLELATGQRLLDVGCGWGSMVIHAARHYGVEATGITLSEEQARLARDRAAAAGVSDRVRILVRDYREIDDRFDAISSIGMVEHVGRTRLDEYFRRLRDMLNPGGLVLNHGIIDRNDTSPRERKRGFVGKYVFPDGDLVALSTLVDAAESAGLETRDVEALRINYALTLRKWVAALETNRERALQVSNEFTYRVWRLYMAGSAVAFERGVIGVDQILLADPTRSWRHGRSQLLVDDDRRPEARTIDLRTETSPLSPSRN